VNGMTKPAKAAKGPAGNSGKPSADNGGRKAKVKNDNTPCARRATRRGRETPALAVDFAPVLFRLGLDGHRVGHPVRPSLAPAARAFPRLRFPQALRGGRHRLSGRFKTIMEKAKITGRILRGADGNGRVATSLSFHSLRHTHISALANVSVAAEVRHRLSGHADDRSHARYTHHEIENLRAAQAKLPRVGAGK